MKKILLFITLLIFTNASSQDSWVRIYDSGVWSIKSFYKIHHPDNINSIFVQHNSNDTLVNSQNGVLKKFIRGNNSWIVPANGYLNTACGTCLNPPYMWTQCIPVPFFMISPHDSSTILKFRITGCADCPDANTLITRNNGSDWESFYNIFGCGGSLIFPNGSDIDPNNESIWYYGYSNSSTNYQTAIFKSTNGGETWEHKVIIPDLRNTSTFQWAENNGGFIKVNPFNTIYIFTAHRDYMMLSTDAGYTFNSISIPPLKELCFDYTGHIIYGVTENKIYRSIDNGLTWSSSDVAFNLTTMEVSPDNNNIIYAGSTTGLYRSSNGGQSWYLYNNTFAPSKNVIGLSKDPNSADTIIVSTKDAVYKVFRDQLTGVNQTGLTVPSTFKLSQNYPNPFNPNTIINYELPEQPSDNSFYNVKLTVYSVLGNEVATLIDQKQNAGRYSVEFDGSKLASGNYFYRIAVHRHSGAFASDKIDAGNFMEVKKMILLK